MGIRLLIGVCYYETVDLPDALLKNGVVEFCFNAHCYNEDAAFDTPNNIHFPRNIAKTANYSAYCDMNEVPALSEEDIKAMNKYLPMALNISQRITNFPINVWEEEKFKAYAHWRFWKHIIIKHKINAVFFEQYPHSRPYHWFIYGLAREMNIPILMLSYCDFKNRYTYGESIESQGLAIEKYYETVAKSMRPDECILEGTMRDEFERLQHLESDIVMKPEYAKMRLQETIKIMYGKHLSPMHFWIPYRLLFRKIFGMRIKNLSGGRRTDRSDAFEAFQRERRLDRRIQDYLRHDAAFLKDYNKIAEDPDYNERYIFYGLQLTPEGTTFPLGGSFCDQITSIQLLARAAEKCGVKVYVKEHFIQAFRSKWFYEAIKQIKNVRLIKNGIPSIELMKNCLAVSTQTGYCMVESAFLGKPALITSECSICRKLPNVFLVHDEEQCEEIICSLLKGFSFDLNDVKRFFYAVQENTIYGAGRNGWDDIKLVNEKEYWKGLQSEVDFISQYFSG